MSEELDPNVEIKEIGIEDIIIPECCREGWDDCPHVINKPQKATRKNIGL